jgi:hypothetical protein
MKTALRVLSAIVEKRSPEPADVEQLRSLAPPLATVSVEEIACEVVQLALKNRASGRASVGSGGQGS